jgi:hypothetical protein
MPYNFSVLEGQILRVKFSDPEADGYSVDLTVVEGNSATLGVDFREPTHKITGNGTVTVTLVAEKDNVIEGNENAVVRGVGYTFENNDGKTEYYHFDDYAIVKILDACTVDLAMDGIITTTDIAYDHVDQLIWDMARSLDRVNIKLIQSLRVLESAEEQSGLNLLEAELSRAGILTDLATLNLGGPIRALFDQIKNEYQREPGDNVPKSDVFEGSAIIAEMAGLLRGVLKYVPLLGLPFKIDDHFEKLSKLYNEQVRIEKLIFDTQNAIDDYGQKLEDYRFNINSLRKCLDLDGVSQQRDIALSGGPPTYWKGSQEGDKVAAVPGKAFQLFEMSDGDDIVQATLNSTSFNMISGGDGFDRVVTDGKAANFVANRLDWGTFSVASVDLAGSAMIVMDVERIEFSDGAVAFDFGGNAGQAYRIYQAAFDRKPDIDGLSYWIKQLDNGMSLKEVAEGFVASAEALSIYGSSSTNSEFIARLYQNVLGRPGEEGGVDHWNGVLNRGVDRATVLAGFSESPENIALVAPSIQEGIWMNFL